MKRAQQLMNSISNTYTRAGVALTMTTMLLPSLAHATKTSLDPMDLNKGDLCTNQRPTLDTNLKLN